LFYKILYRITAVIKLIFTRFLYVYYVLRGAKIDSSVSFSKLYFTWPHKVSIGANCVLEHSVYFKYDGPYSKGKSIIIGKNVFVGAGTEFNIKESIIVGNDCLIASGCRFVDHDHGMDKQTLMRLQLCPAKEIIIEDNVWIGANAVILKGVTIGSGAIVAAGAVITHSVLSNEICGGVPAKKIGERK
jgi:acetyltransferase-like isoleucine patch superfamily enzyme